MKIESKELPNGVRVVNLEGHLDVAGVGAVEAHFLQSCGGDRPRVLVDLSRTGFVASLGIRMLLQGVKTASTRNGRLLLLNPASFVASALEISGLGQFVVRGSEEGAAAMLLASAK